MIYCIGSSVVFVMNPARGGGFSLPAGNYLNIIYAALRGGTERLNLNTDNQEKLGTNTNKKKRSSNRKKKAGVVIGIIFGTVVIFVASFLLSFNFIINPVTVTPIGDAKLEKENSDLKDKVQLLEDQVDSLNSKLDKYKTSGALSNVKENDSSSKSNTSTSSSQSKTTNDSTTKKSSSSDKTTTSDSSGTHNTAGSGSDSTGKTDSSEVKKPSSGTPSASQQQTDTGSASQTDASGSGFSPETTVTPEGGTPEDKDDSIPVIDIGE